MTISDVWITGIFATASTTIPALIVYVRAKAKAENERLRKKLVDALSDLHFYQTLEDEFCREWKDVTQESAKSTFRKLVTIEHGLVLTGKLPPSRVARYLAEFSEK